MNPDKDETVSVDGIMEEVAREADRRRGFRLEPAELGHPAEERRRPARPGAAEPVQQEGALRIGDFLPLQGEAFVRRAYTVLLGRSPDPEGLSHYGALLESGRVSKVDILGRLRFSREGRRRGVRVKGLMWRYPFHLLYRMPLLGHGLRVATAVANLPLVFRHLRQLEQTAASFQTVQGEADTRMREIEAGLERWERLQEENGAILKVEFANHAREWAETGRALRAEIAASAEGIEHKVRVFESRFSASLAELGQRSQGWERLQEQVLSDYHIRLARAEEQTADELAALCREQARTAKSVRTLSAELAAMRETLTGGAQSLEARAVELERIVGGLRAWVTLQEGRLTRLWEARGAGPAASAPAEEAPPGLDALYAEFEARFRSSRAEVKDNLRFYLPLVREAGAGSPDRPLLDLGCGRGEWLELLGEEGLTAAGVDFNPVMVKECQKRGLAASRAEVMTWLVALDDKSLGAVSCFHLIEHLALDRQLPLLEEVLRVLKPGGLFVLESPNPENVVVGSCSFYLDPTHLRPVPPRTALFLLEARGFERAETRPLHPCRIEEEGVSGDLAEAARHFFYGPQDYAVWGYKPA